MPRGFLVKRTKTSAVPHPRVRRGSDDDRSDSSSDVEPGILVIGSPDSGICQSPHAPRYHESPNHILSPRPPECPRYPDIDHREWFAESDRDVMKTMPIHSRLPRTELISPPPRLPYLSPTQRLAYHSPTHKAPYPSPQRIYPSPTQRMYPSPTQHYAFTSPTHRPKMPFNSPTHKLPYPSPNKVYPSPTQRIPMTERVPFAERVPLTNRNCHSLNSTPVSSPIAVPQHLRDAGYPSPLYFSSFDRLTVSSPSSQSECIDLTSPKFTRPGRISLSHEPTPSSPNKRRTNSESDSKPKTPKKSKAIRKINFDTDTTSPVSGTIIRDVNDDTAVQVCGDIDSAYNIVDVTPEARAELDLIENKIGDYVCQLCKELYPDAFQLAQHRCSRIIHVEYRCPECDKVFNCPANLASHRRWHKPKPNSNKPPLPKLLSAPTENRHFNPHPNSIDLRMPSNKMASVHQEINQSPETLYGCEICGKKFRRQAYLRKHLISHLIKNGSKVYPCDLTVPVVRDTTAVPSNNNDGEFVRPDYACKPYFTKHLPPPPRVNSPIDEMIACQHCTESFGSISKLAQHMVACHTTDKPVINNMPLAVSNRPC